MEQKDRILKGLQDYQEPKVRPFPPVGDWHAINGYAVFGEDFKTLYQKDPERYKSKRDIAKAVGLALTYGGTEYTIAETLNISREEARTHVANFFANLQKFKKYQDERLKRARKEGYTRDLFGRIRYLPKIMNDAKTSQEWKVKAAMERLCVNFPAQSGGAGQLKLIMIAIGNYMIDMRLNRTHGNLPVTYHPYTRIVGISKSDLTQEITNILGQTETGNCKLLVMDDKWETPLEEYDRPLRLRMRFLKDSRMKILW